MNRQSFPPTAQPPFWHRLRTWRLAFDLVVILITLASDAFLAAAAHYYLTVDSDDEGDVFQTCILFGIWSFFTCVGAAIIVLSESEW